MVEEILQLIDFKKIESILEGHFKSTGFVAGILDLEGSILATSSWQNICKNFHRSHAQSCKRCKESDLELGSKKLANKQFHSYQCLNGLVDVVTPIVVNKHHIANLYCGQFLYQKPDRDFFIQQAETFSYDKTEYLRALEEVPVVSKEKVKDVMAFLTLLVAQISDLTLQKIEQEQTLANLQQTEETLRKSEARLETAQRIALLGNFEHDFKKDTLWWSDEVFRIFGIKKTPIPPGFETFLGNLSKKEADKLYKKVDRALKTGEGYAFTFSYQYSEKVLKYVFVKAEVILDKNGKPKGLKGTVQDVTERTKTQQELKSSEHRYKTLFERSNDAILILNVNTKILDVNDETVNLLGYSKQELLEFTIFDLHPKSEFQKIKENKKHVDNSKQGSSRFESQWLTKDKRILDVEISSKIVDKEKGIVQAIVRDITKQKQADQKIQDIISFYENLTENVQDGIWVTDKNDNIFFANKGMENISGVPKKLISGNNVLKDFPKETTEKFNVFYNKAKKTLKPTWYEVKVTTPAGTDTWQNGWLVPLQKEGKFDGIICTIRDVSERKKAEENLQKNSELLQEAQRIAHIAHWTFDPKTGMPFWSEELYRIYARDPKDGPLPYSEHPKLVHPDDWEWFDATVKNTAETGKPFDIVLRILRPDGSIRYINSICEPLLDADGAVLQMRGTIQDITEAKLIENELIKAKELAENANRLKTKFLQNMSHEIRTPMNGIMGFAELLVDSEISYEKRKAYSRIITRSSQQLLHVIDDLLEISALETKRKKVDKQTFKLNEVLTDLYAIFQLKLKHHNLSLFLNKALDDDQSLIVSDRSKLEKILSNLIENAFKYTNEGYIELGYIIQDSTIELYVKDTGIGISPEKHESIFERFSQGETDFAKRKDGLGLGLSICKENALLLGGDIRVESAEGEGAVFYVSIPYKPAVKAQKEQSVETKKVLHTKTQSKTILVAEDEEINFFLLEALFDTNIDGNYQLIHAWNGEEAIDYCMNNREIELVLMDVKMPTISGFEAAEKIKALRPELPIIAQTAYATEADRIKAKAHKCDDYISKPIDKKQLKILINKHLD